MFPFWGWWSDGVRRRNYLCVLRSNELSTIFACKAPVLITFALELAHRLNLVVKHLDCFLQFPGCGFGLKEIMGFAFGHTRGIGINLWVYSRGRWMTGSQSPWALIFLTCTLFSKVIFLWSFSGSASLLQGMATLAIHAYLVVLDTPLLAARRQGAAFAFASAFFLGAGEFVLLWSFGAAAAGFSACE